MRVEITLKDDKGDILNSFEGDALQPYVFRTLPDRPFVQETDTARNVFFDYVYQPHVIRTLKQR